METGLTDNDLIQEETEWRINRALVILFLHNPMNQVEQVQTDQRSNDYTYKLHTNWDWIKPQHVRLGFQPFCVSDNQF